VSDERWIKTSAPTDDVEALDLYDAAEGQRVETWRICATHGERAHDHSTVAGELWECWIGESEGDDCDCEDGTLILPPEAAS
jgi:hypothetical protein